MAKLELIHLNKTFSPAAVPVKDLSLVVADGDFLTLLGPSGCGKSTTLRLIAGLEQPTKGQIQIGGVDMSHRSPGDRNIAMVFQSYALYPHLSVYDNMASGLKLRKIPSSEIRTRVETTANLLGMAELLKYKPAQLSGGQRQRVALGRALVRNPDVFLLDEPLSNLDALLREHVRAEMKQLFAHQQAPVVYVTHDQTEAMTLSTQVAVLYDGILQQLDTPARIYAQPANQFVAGFIGSPQMNLLTLPCQNNQAHLGDTPLPLPSGYQGSPDIVLGIRPEHVTLTAATAAYPVEAHIYLVENLGMGNLISAYVQGADGLTLRSLLPTDQHWQGNELTFYLPQTAIHWFDRASGLRVE